MSVGLSLLDNIDAFLFEIKRISYHDFIMLMYLAIIKTAIDVKNGEEDINFMEKIKAISLFLVC